MNDCVILELVGIEHASSVVRPDYAQFAAVAEIGRGNQLPLAFHFVPKRHLKLDQRENNQETRDFRDGPMYVQTAA